MKHVNYLSFFLLTLFSISFISCSDDDDNKLNTGITNQSWTEGKSLEISQDNELSVSFNAAAKWVASVTSGADWCKLNTTSGTKGQSTLKLSVSTSNILGKAGEDAAAKYLEQNGYTIRDRNWRKNHLELDIVADKDKELIIVEVKTRSNTDYIEPQDAVNWQKIRRIVVAADAYIKHFCLDAPVRFDIITAVGEPGAFRIEHLKEAFYPPMF